MMMMANVKSYLKDLQEREKTLVTKISYEYGKPVCINEYSKYDQLINKLEDKNKDDIIQKILSEIEKQQGFSGFIAFELVQGKVTGYSTYYTYKGDTLKRLLKVV